MGNNKATLKITKTLNESNTDEGREMKYYLSNQEDSDIDRQHDLHFLKRHIYQNNFSVPIEEKLIQGGCKVLDVGCGPGTWLLDLASVYQDSYFFGIDIKPVYPKEIKPGNLEFSEADLLNGLPFPDNEFDFAHQGSMSFIIKPDQWSYVISELIRVTKPGGFIEIVEYIAFVNSGPLLTKLTKLHSDLSSQRGVDMTLTSHIDKMIELHQDVTKVHRDEKSFVIGPTGGRAGMALLDILNMFHTSATAIKDLGSQGISKEEITSMLENLAKELEETSPELNICRFWAQKNF